MKRNIVSIGTVIMMLFLFNATQARVWYVHPDSTRNCIQDCLDSCATNDTVLVGPGTYFENIVWPNTQGIHLISELGPVETIIDGDSAEDVIRCYYQPIDTTTTIKGFTIQNGYSSANATGGGIDCACVGITIVDNILQHNTARHGGAIHCQGTDAIISGNTITNNSAYNGGGIRIGYMSCSIITHNIITNNSDSTGGGGIYVRGTAGADILYNEISYNNSMGNGGGLGFNGMGIVSNNLIHHNTAVNGGGIQGWSGSEVPEPIEISYNTIEYNEAQNSGGGISLRYGGLIRKNLISYNSASVGAGIYYCSACYSTVVDSCAISANNGDGMTCDSIVTDTISLEIRHCDIFGNSGYGVRNLDTIWLNAEDNWWGDATGPYHSSNPNGLGDTVSDYVDFEPWLLGPVGLFEQIRPIDRHPIVRTAIVRGVLNLQSSISNQQSEITLLDITGRKVADLKAGANDIRHLAPGIYFIRFANEKIIRKIIITK